MVADDDKEYQVDISYLYPELVEGSHEAVRAKFEPLVVATIALPEVDVMSALTLRIVRLALAGKALAKDGLEEESQLPLRSAIECMVNLAYIMDVGPALGNQTMTELAQRFIDYGHIAYAKMLRAREPQSRAAYKRKFNYTDAQFDMFYAEKMRLEAEAIQNGSRKDRWNPNTTFQGMADKVRQNLPSYMEATFADMLLVSMQRQNSAVHADALSLRTEYKAKGNGPLQVVRVDASNYANAAAVLATWGWKAMAAYYNQSTWLTDITDKQIRTLMRGKLDEAKAKESRLIELPSWLI